MHETWYVKIKSYCLCLFQSSTTRSSTPLLSILLLISFLVFFFFLFSFFSETAACPAAVNKDKVPFMATAGMRLLTKEQNDKIWKDICGAKLSSGGYTFATLESGLCGTIPG